jgi:hypothetical protein
VPTYHNAVSALNYAQPWMFVGPCVNLQFYSVFQTYHMVIDAAIIHAIA